MTEKRFTLNTDSTDRYYQITDEETGDLFDVYKLSQCETLCDLLNSLNDENEQLKKENKTLETQLYCNSDDGVCTICKNHYLVKGKTYDKYYISKCKKEHDECSTNVLRHCKDFEFKELQE